MKRRKIGSVSPWEDVVGYSRAVRIGRHVAVSGTTAPGENAYEQARDALTKIGDALRAAGADFDDVIRTRMFVTDIANWESVGRAHAEIFKEIKPAATMIGVAALIGKDLLVEIEVDAIIRKRR